MLDAVSTTSASGRDRAGQVVGDEQHRRARPMHAGGQIGGAALIAVIVEQHHDVAAGQLDHGAQVATAGVGEQPHAGPQLLQVRGEMHRQQVREPAAVQVQRPAGVGQQRDRGVDGGAGHLRQRLLGAFVLRAGLVQQAVQRAGIRRAGGGGRQPGDRPVGLGRQLGAQRHLQIGEPFVAKGLREPEHGRRAHFGAFGEPCGAGQPGARIVGEQRPADPTLGLAQRREGGAGARGHGLVGHVGLVASRRDERMRRHRQIVHRDGDDGLRWQGFPRQVAEPGRADHHPGVAVLAEARDAQGEVVLEVFRRAGRWR